MSLKSIGTGIFGGSIVLLITINIFNALNYFFHFTMARMLSASDYGTLVALMSIFYIFGVSTEAIQTIITKYSSQEKSDGKVKNIIKRALRKGLKYSIVSFVIFSILAFFIGIFLGIEYSLIFLSGTIIFSSVLLPVMRGALQGKKKFNSLGFNMIAESVVKILLAVLFVYIGFRVYGAIMAIFLGTLVAFLFSIFNLRQILSSKESKADASGIYGYSFPVLAVMITIIVFYSIDVILVKRYFSADIAGQYAMASTLAKIIFFGTMPIGKVMFPISSERSNNGKHTFHIFVKALVILGICVAAALAVFYFFPGLLVRIFSGANHQVASALVFYLAIFISLVSFANLILLYKLSLGRMRNYGVLFIFIVLEIIMLHFFHHTLLEYCITLIFLSLLMLFGSIFLFNAKK